MPKILSIATVNGQADAMAATYDHAYLRVYAGAMPGHADAPLTGQTLLAECRFGATAFGAASAGAITANAITGEDAALASGNASFYRVVASDDATVLEIGDIGVTGSGAVLEMSDIAIVVGDPVDVTSFTHTIPTGAA
jgi:TPP-dependent pyruvate/acetoin dehydrogenase alpha subunit